MNYFLSSMLLVIGALQFAYAQDKETLREAIKQHDKAVHVMDEWMRDPFVHLAPDGYYYLSCTRPNALFPDSLPAMQFWRSRDLVEWEDLGAVWQSKHSEYGKELLDAAQKRGKEPAIWAPEVHFVNDKWVIVNTSNMRVANLIVTESDDITGPYDEPMGLKFGFHRDPTLFIDDDGTPWLLSNCAEIIKLKRDFSAFEGTHKLLNPSNRLLGHEGVYVIKMADKYVMFGTGWSTDTMRKGTYNLYYCVADKVTGPYGPRKFAGRFLGHGTPFKDKDGRWWCTAFYNANHPPLDPDKASDMDLSNSAFTINEQGLTLVPLDIFEEDGEINVVSKDPAYRYPGKEEIQQFELK